MIFPVLFFVCLFVMLTSTAPPKNQYSISIERFVKHFIVEELWILFLFRSEIEETSENTIEDNDDDEQTNDWSAKKRGKWPMQYQRRKEWMDKRREMMSQGDGQLNAGETDTDDAEVINKERKYPMMYRRKWHNKGANDDERSPNRGDKKRKWRHKKHEKGRSCICHLEPEQKEKLRELIMKEGLEKEFPQIVPPEGDSVDDDVIQITDKTSDAVV